LAAVASPTVTNNGAPTSAAVGVLDPAALSWRPLTMADVPALTRLTADSETVDQTGEHYDEADISHDLADAALDLTVDSLAAVLPDGELVCAGFVRAPRAVRTEHRIHLFGQVHPRWRRRGLGRRLLDWQEERAALVHRERHPELPGEYEVHTYNQVSGRHALYESAGYHPARWWNVMRRDITGAPVAPRPLPDGLRLVAYDASYDDAVRRAHNEAFAGHWGSSERDPGEWAEWFTGHRAFDAASSFLILDGDEIAAYLLAYFWAAEAAATGIREGYIGQLGTRARWRKRRLASVLLDQALVAFERAGYERAALDVDTANESGALGLYLRHGYAIAERQVTYVRPIG
jgi:mycothiol synthase